MQGIQGFNISQILQMLNNQTSTNRGGQIKKIKLRMKQLFPEANQYLSYPEHLQNLLNCIFYDETTHPNDKNIEIKLQNILKFQPKSTSMPICNKRLNARQLTFRCYDCMTHQASVLCKACFEKGNHKGHRYSQMASGGGNCDCGNRDAIKVQGFCSDHPGKADPVKVQVDEKQEKYFLDVFLTLFQWFFRLYDANIFKSSDELGQVIATYLTKLNQSSLYYNTLTYKLLYHQRLNCQDEILIDLIFKYGVKCVNFAKKMTNLFFILFSLEIFKYKLTVSFCRAYNENINFEKSKFKDLYIQLFANNELVHRMVIQEKLVLYPYNREYEYSEYVENLMFLTTIKPFVAAEFFEILMLKTIIRSPQLDSIEKDVQKGNKHIMQVIMQNLNTQNSYYTLHEAIVGLLRFNNKALKIMLNNYLDAVLDTKYSYNKNNIVMPFHKVLSLIILMMVDGNLEEFNIKKIQQIIQGEGKLRKSSEKIFRLILKTYNQLALTYFQNSYFDNYANLYIKSGNTIVVYDHIMFKICLKIFEQTNNIQELNKIIAEFLLIDNHEEKKLKTKKGQNQLMQIQSSSEMQDESDEWEDVKELVNEQGTDEEKYSIQTLRRSIELMKIMIQNCISDRAESAISSSMQLNNKFSREKRENTIAELLNNFKQITAENAKLIVRHFLDVKPQAQENFIKKYLNFDKNKKKYLVNNEVTENISTNKLPLSLYQTLKKIGEIFSIEMKNQTSILNDFICSKQHLKRLKIIFSPQIVKKLCNQFIEKLFSLKKHNEINAIFLDFFNVIKILQGLLKKQSFPQIEQFFEDVRKISQKGELSLIIDHRKQSTQSAMQKTAQKLKKEEHMKKFNQKKMKRLLEMKSKQQKHDIYDKIREQEAQELCIICKENKENSSGLCYLAELKQSNAVQVLNLAEGSSLTINSCFHSIHYSCLLTKFNHFNDSIPCPLCKSQSNTMLPNEKQINNFTMIKDIYERILVTKALEDEKKSESKKGYDKQFEELGMIIMLKSISSVIQKSLMKNENALNQKSQRLLNLVYNLIMTLYQKILSKKQIDEQQKGMEKLLKFLQEKAISLNVNKSNYYACQYLILKILFFCLSLQSDKCSDILCQSIIASINRQDVRKIWQMCNQLVSLPEFRLRQPKQGLHSVIQSISREIIFYRPPELIKELIQLRDSSQQNCKNGHQICICLICQNKVCFECKTLKQHFTEVHCGEGLSFNLLTGGFVYYISDKPISIPSLYCNDIGIEWKPSKSPEGYIFDYQVYNEMTKQIVNENIFKYLSSKYPSILKKNIMLENLF